MIETKRCATTLALLPALLATPAAGQDRLDDGVALATFDSAWSRVHRTHCDTAFNGVDWVALRDELRPRASRARTSEDLRGVIGEMLGRLGDSHYVLIPGEVADAVDPDSLGAAVDPARDRTGDLGMAVRLLDRAFVISEVDSAGPAFAAGIRAGWVLESIGGRNLADALDRIGRLPTERQRRNALTQLVFGANGLQEGAPGSTVDLKLLDGADRPVDVTLERRRRPGQVVRLGNLPAFFARIDHERLPAGDGCLGLISMSVWMVPLAPRFDDAVDELRDCDGMIIDIRGNPGGVAGMVSGIGGHFLTERTALGHMRTRDAALDIRANPRLTTRDGRRVEPFDGPLAILVDELSVSTSEFFAGGMQAIGRARVFGRTTAGQALPATFARLPNGDVLMYVVADFTAARGVRLEGIGVRPDVVVPLRRSDLLAGRDAVLIAALDWLRGDEPTN